jgi:hypothetical protein
MLDCDFWGISYLINDFRFKDNDSMFSFSCSSSIDLVKAKEAVSWIFFLLGYIFTYYTQISVKVIYASRNGKGELARLTAQAGQAFVARFLRMRSFRLLSE